MMKKTMIVVHCADTLATMDIGAEEIRRWHVEERGWSDIGYAHVIRRDGTIEGGRDLDGDGDVADEIGAHAAGFNRQSIGVCLVGGKGDNGQPCANYTLEQYRSLKKLVWHYESRFQGIVVLGHCDLPGVKKACPVFDVRIWHNN